jgi:hypothetical protein
MSTAPDRDEMSMAPTAEAPRPSTATAPLAFAETARQRLAAAVAGPLTLRQARHLNRLATALGTARGRGLEHVAHDAIAYCARIGR